MSRPADPAFEDWVQRARDTDILTIAREQGAAVKKRGRDWAGPCPACGGEDGFVITPGQKDPNKRFLCRKAGTGGDVIAMVEHVSGATFVQAVEAITKEPPPRGESRPIDPAVTKERREERKDRDIKADAEEKRERAEKIATAADVWAIGQDIFGTHAEKYLAARGISLNEELAVDLRFVPSLDYFGFENPDTDEQRRLGAFPCMIAAVRNAAGDVIAVHRTYLDPSEPAKLRPPGDRTRNLAKKIVGKARGGIIRLGFMSEVLAMGEGIETTASWFGLGIGPDDVSIAAAYSLGNMAGGATGTVRHPSPGAAANATIPNGEPDYTRPGVALPPEVRTVILLMDGDSDRAFTLASILTAGRRYRHEGREVLVCIAPDGMDFNDLALAIARGEDFAMPRLVAFDEFETMALQEVQPPFRTKFGALFLGELDSPGPEHEYFIDDFLTIGDKSVIGGPSGSGKSFLAIHAGMCVATGMDFFGRPVKKGLVVYQAGEGARGVKKRLRAWRKHFGVPFTNDTPFVLLQSQVDLWRPEGDTEALIREVKELERVFGMPAMFVVIDTLATATGGADENSGKDMGTVMQNVSRINSATGAHVCLVHHLNADGKKLRGHTSIGANIDQAIYVTRNEETRVRTVKIGKQKDDDDNVSFQFELASVFLGERPDGRPITSCVVVDVGMKAELQEREARDRGLKVRENNVQLFRSLLDAIEAHGIQAPSDLRLPLGTRVVEYKHWRADFASKAPIDQEPGEAGRKRHADAIRKRIETGGQALQNSGLIDRKRVGDTAFVWWTGKPVKGFPQTYERVAKVASMTDGEANGADPDDSIEGFI